MPVSHSSASERNRLGSKTRKSAGVTIKRKKSNAMRRYSETWFDEECILIAPAVKITDYSVFAERDVTKVKLAALVRIPSYNNPSVSALVKDDEEGNVYISNKDL